jgi:cytochrome P450
MATGVMALTILLSKVGLSRVALKDFTFSDGMVVPAGNAIGTPILPLHHKVSASSDQEDFDGFRYSSMNEENTGPTKHQMVNTGLNYLTFGHGKHVWYDYLI